MRKSELTREKQRLLGEVILTDNISNKGDSIQGSVKRDIRLLIKLFIAFGIVELMVAHELKKRQKEELEEVMNKEVSDVL